VKDRFAGALIGTAVGDSVGLPAEGLSRSRARRFFKGEWRQRLLPGIGMISDDTEHTIFVAQALLVSSNPQEFARRLAFSLRWWLLALPAGVGFGTLRAIMRLWCGISPRKSGVHSAGNGAAMRVAPIAVLFADQPEKLKNFVRASTEVTHRDERANTGALAVAKTIAWCVSNDTDSRPGIELWTELLRNCARNDQDWAGLVDEITEAATADRSVVDFADNIGLSTGVTGYVYHTVPVALYAWYRHFGDYEKTLTAVFDCGGDTDTTGAIAGALAGVVVGPSGIPASWKSGLRDWPRGLPLLNRLADSLARVSESAEPAQPLRYCWLAVPLRNFVFLIVVLAHGFRRLLPPY